MIAIRSITTTVHVKATPAVGGLRPLLNFIGRLRRRDFITTRKIYDFIGAGAECYFIRTEVSKVERGNIYPPPDRLT